MEKVVAYTPEKMREYQRERYLKNREKIRAKQKAAYATLTPEQRHERNAKQYQRHREHVLTYGRERYLAKRSEIAEYGRRWRAGRKDIERERHLVAKYGLTAEDYEALLVVQKQLCALCHQPMLRNKIEVDHDHVTGNVRGLIHHGCNTALGLLGDTPEGVMAAYEYLARAR